MPVSWYLNLSDKFTHVHKYQCIKHVSTSRIKGSPSFTDYEKLSKIDEESFTSWDRLILTFKMYPTIRKLN